MLLDGFSVRPGHVFRKPCLIALGLLAVVGPNIAVCKYRASCGLDVCARNSSVFTYSTFQPNYSKSPQGNQTRFPEDVDGPHRKIIKKHLEKSRNTTMGNLHMRIQGLQSTKETPPDTDLEDKIKANMYFCATVEPSTTKEGNIYSDLCRRLPTTSSTGNKYIYVMYVYDCNAILTPAMNNRSYR